MLQNAYSLAKIGADTTENEQHFAEILPIGRWAVQASSLIKSYRAERSGDDSAAAMVSGSFVRD